MNRNLIVYKLLK